MARKQPQLNKRGAEKWLARRIIEWSTELVQQRVVVKVYWVAGHMGVAGNEKTDEAAKEVAENPDTRLC